MAKNTRVGEAETNSNEAQELQALRERLSQVEKINAELAEQNKKFVGAGGLEEVRQAARKNRKDGTVVSVKEFRDYVPLKLYHVSGVNIGKVVGPLHPDLAEDTFMRFATKGIKLSVNKPTAEQIAAYKETEAFKFLDEKEIKRRLQRHKSTRESEIVKLTRAVEKATGERMVGNIKSQDEVGRR